jgi:hypothetical protein
MHTVHPENERKSKRIVSRCRQLKAGTYIFFNLALDHGMLKTDQVHGLKSYLTSFLLQYSTYHLK